MKSFYQIPLTWSSFPWISKNDSVQSSSTIPFTYRSNVNYTAIFADGLSPGASIHYKHDDDFRTTTVQRASEWDSPSFSVTLKPATEEDVQFIVRQSNKNGLKFYATGGAHAVDYGLSQRVQNVVNIDLSNFKQQSLDVEKNTVTVGPALSFVDFDFNVYGAGKSIPLGNSFCVNMIGASIGGGVGPYFGLYGPVVDSILSMRIVTAEGGIVTASFEENQDLFWAARGAAANFGIVVEATFRIYEAPNNGELIQGDFILPGSANESLWKLIESWDKPPGFPKEMGLTIIGGYNHTGGNTFMTIMWSYFGNQQQAQQMTDDFVALGPLRWRTFPVRWDQRSQTQGFGMASNMACKKGIYNNQFAVSANITAPATYREAFDDYAAFASTRPWFKGTFWLQRFDTRVAKSLPEERRSSYPGRDWSHQMVIYNTYDGPAHNAEVYEYSRNVREKLVKTSGLGELQTYVNYAFGDEGIEAWYGRENLPRLVGLKRQWDPHGRFDNINVIPRELPM